MPMVPTPRHTLLIREKAPHPKTAAHLTASQNLLACKGMWGRGLHSGPAVRMKSEAGRARETLSERTEERARVRVWRQERDLREIESSPPRAILCGLRRRPERGDSINADSGPSAAKRGRTYMHMHMHM